MSNDVIWLLAGLVLCLAEIFSLALVLLSFGAAAFAAAAAAALGAGGSASLAVFAAVSLLTLLVLRPLAVKRLGRRADEGAATNAEALIGRAGLVSVAVPERGRGRVRVGGEDWSAMADEALPEGTAVVVESVEGVTLRVRRS